MVTFFFRNSQPGVHSIEELFATVQQSLSDTILFKNYILHKKGASIHVLWINGREATKNKSSVNHITGDVHYLAPFLPKKNTILTIHDLRPLFRGNKIKRILIKLLWFSIPVRSVRYVTVISQATKEELLRQVKINPEIVKIIPNCISPEFTYYPKEFNYKNPNILHIGTKENKNLERLIEAVEGLKCTLTIVGKLSPSQKDFLVKHKVVYVNKFNLNFQEVVEEYRKADLISFTSLYEGFGLPIIEAQATGRPVLTSNISSMPEVAGEGALLVDPYQVDEIRTGLRKIIEDQALRLKLVEKGLENIKRFSAQNVAMQYAHLYFEIMEENNG